MRQIITFFVLQVLLYFLMVVDFRATAGTGQRQQQKRFTGFTAVKRISESKTKLESYPRASLIGIYLTLRIFGQ